MLETLHGFPSLSIVIIGAFLVFFLLNHRDHTSNLWMAGFILSLSLHFLNVFLLTRTNIPHFGLVFGWLYGPLTMHVILSHSKEIPPKSLLHFLPALLLLIWILVMDAMRSRTPVYELEILRVIVFLHLITYIIISARLTRALKKKALQTRSHIAEGKIFLVQGILRAVCVFFFFALLESYVSPFLGEEFYQGLILCIAVLVLLGLLGIIYQGLENPFVFKALSSQEHYISAEAQQQYSRSKLTPEEGQTYLKQLLAFMDQEKPYRHFQLSIDELANMSNIPPRYLSQIINEQLKKNFFDFINSYRIEAAKVLLMNPEKRISEVMYDVGFSSRSSFNTHFKKYTGMTPSQYRKSL